MQKEYLNQEDNINEAIEDHINEVQEEKITLVKKNNSTEKYCTKDQDDPKPLFDELTYQTIAEASDSFDSQESKQDIDPLSQNVKVSQNNGDQRQEQEYQDLQETQIEQTIQLSKINVKKLGDIINQTRQLDFSQLKLSPEMSELPKNMNKLKQILNFENNEDLEIITLLLMLLIKFSQVNVQNFFDDLKKDDHLIKLYEIYESYNNMPEQEQDQDFIEQEQEEEAQKIQIDLEEGFKNSLIQKIEK